MRGKHQLCAPLCGQKKFALYWNYFFYSSERAPLNHSLSSVFHKTVVNTLSSALKILSIFACFLLSTADNTFLVQLTSTSNVLWRLKVVLTLAELCITFVSFRDRGVFIAQIDLHSLFSPSWPWTPNPPALASQVMWLCLCYCAHLLYFILLTVVSVIYLNSG